MWQIVMRSVQMIWRRLTKLYDCWQCCVGDKINLWAILLTFQWYDRDNAAKMWYLWIIWHRDKFIWTKMSEGRFFKLIFFFIFQQIFFRSRQIFSRFFKKNHRSYAIYHGEQLKCVCHHGCILEIVIEIISHIHPHNPPSKQKNLHF